MATNINRPFMINTGLNEQNSLVNLLQNISPAIENEIDIVKHSQYYSDVNFINMIQQVCMWLTSGRATGRRTMLQYSSLTPLERECYEG